MPNKQRSLKVFLCHAHSDKDEVHDLYLGLTEDGVDVWLDKEKLLPGQDWEYEIRKAVRKADIVVVCLSKQFNQAGFRQKEVRLALDTAMEQPEGEIFIVPARLEECDTLECLRKWHWVDLFEENGYEMLMRALSARANKIGAVLQAKRSMLSRITTPVELKRPVLDKKPGGTSPMPARSKKEVSQNSEPEVETTETHPSLKKLNITIVVALIGFAGTVIAGLLSSPWIGNLFSPEPASTLTITATSTLTPAPTMTSTSSETPTTTLTFTPSGPFSYIVQEGDTLDALANKFNLGPDGVLLILDYNPEIMRNNGVFFIGQELLIPSPGTIQSTRTPISPDLPRGTKVDYIVLPGDTLAGIAAKFNSSPNAIIDINGADVADVNNLFVGRHLQIPVNLVTATATLPPSSTPVTSASLPPTSTPVTAQ